MAFFGRKVLVQLGGVDIGNSYEDLRVKFSVTKTLGGEPNSGNIEIYGLSRTSVAQYLSANRDLRVRLLAGYGDVPTLLFDGFPVRKEGLRFDSPGAERILKIRAKDGLRRYERARVNMSLAESTKVEDVLVEVLKELALPVDTIDMPPDIELTQGTNLTGQASEILDKLAETSGADWSIQDGKFQFIRKRGTRRGQGPLFSDELANIIGAPQRVDGGIEVTTFLQGTVVPGSLFRVRTRDGFHDGDYKAREVRYTGDSYYGDEFYTIVMGGSYETQAQGERREADEELKWRNKVFRSVDRFIDPAGTLLDIYKRDTQ